MHCCIICSQTIYSHAHTHTGPPFMPDGVKNQYDFWKGRSSFWSKKKYKYNFSPLHGINIDFLDCKEYSNRAWVLYLEQFLCFPAGVLFGRLCPTIGHVAIQLPKVSMFFNFFMCAQYYAKEMGFLASLLEKNWFIEKKKGRK